MTAKRYVIETANGPGHVPSIHAETNCFEHAICEMDTHSVEMDGWTYYPSIRDRLTGRSWDRPSDARSELNPDLYKSLVTIEIPEGMEKGEIVSAYLRATFVAAEIEHDEKFYKEMMLNLAEKGGPGGGE